MVDYIFSDDKLLCVFEERLDTSGCLEFEKELLDKAGNANTAVVFDMRAVNYIASSFLKICFRISKEKGDGNLSLINVSPEIKKILKIAGADKHIKID